MVRNKYYYIHHEIYSIVYLFRVIHVDNVLKNSQTQDGLTLIRSRIASSLGRM
jgi:hypothetical protein